MKKTLAIVVGGGPAPGINGVISSATIEAINNGLRVIGILDGFKWLSLGNTDHVIELTIDRVSRIHTEGGSILRTSRVNPTKDPKMLENVVESLERLNVSYLMTIGGDDTAYTAYKIYEATGGSIPVVHVPKTIDNDLPLPDNMPTFGFETARHVGMLLVQNLMEDARTTQRWYIVITMGREAGHLALGIGKAAGVTLTLIPEEFHAPLKFEVLRDTIIGSILKRKVLGKDYGLVVVAEGIAEKLEPRSLKLTSEVPRDEHGHVLLSEIPLGRVLKESIEAELERMGIKMRLVEQNIGYVLRSARPLAFDIEYTRNLGYGATKFIVQGGSGAIIAIRRGMLHPIYFEDVMDKETGRTRVRVVNIHSESYEVALHYMIRLKKSDLEGEMLQKLAEIARMDPETFRERFLPCAIEG